MLKVGVGLLAIGAFACILPTAADAQSRSDLRNCRYITPANAARCCRIVTITRHNVDVCTGRARAISRGAPSAYAPRAFGSFQNNPDPVLKPVLNPVNDGLNPAGNPSQGGGFGITSPNFGPQGPGPGPGLSGNPGLGQGGGFAGPPGQNK